MVITRAQPLETPASRPVKPSGCPVVKRVQGLPVFCESTLDMPGWQLIKTILSFGFNFQDIICKFPTDGSYLIFYEHMYNDKKEYGGGIVLIYVKNYGDFSDAVQKYSLSRLVGRQIELQLVSGQVLIGILIELKEEYLKLSVSAGRGNGRDRQLSRTAFVPLDKIASFHCISL